MNGAETRHPMPPSEWELREGAWAVVKASRELEQSGHGRAVSWARGWLGLEDRKAERRSV